MLCEYNGMQIPDLPNYDKSKYPYVMVCYCSLMFELFISTLPLYMGTSYGIKNSVIMSSANTMYYRSRLYEPIGPDDLWSIDVDRPTQGPEGGGQIGKWFSPVDFVYSNYDILHEDGTVVFPSSVKPEYEVTENPDWFLNLFINEAKPAMKRHSVIQGDADPELQEKLITENGEYTPDSGYDGLSKVTVDVEPKLQSKIANANGIVTADTGYDGLSKVTVDVEPVLQEKTVTVTASGEVTPDSGYDGLSKVNVSIDELAQAIGYDRARMFRKHNTLSGCFRNISEIAHPLPFFDTSSITNMSFMFGQTFSLDNDVPLYDTSNVTNMTGMFSWAMNTYSLPLFDTRKVTAMGNMINHLTHLTVVPAWDMRSVDAAGDMMYGCEKITECWVRNIKTDLQVGSGSSWGHLLTVESLIHLIKELRDTGSTKTLTMGTVNIEKLANVYVKIISVTDEMRAEDDLIDEKLPFVQCESTDEGAMLITQYAKLKNWNIV